MTNPSTVLDGLLSKSLSTYINGNKGEQLKRVSHHRASELLRQFPVVGFRESWGDQVCVCQDLRVLETHASPRLHTVGFVHQGERRLLWL